MIDTVHHQDSLNTLGATTGPASRAVDTVRQANPRTPWFRDHRPFVTFLKRLPALGLIALARLYQRTLSPLLGPTCRFHPSCSEYFIRSVHRHGALHGAVRGFWRVCRCHPFHPGGYDPP